MICSECTSALDDLAVDGGAITADQLAEAAAIDEQPEETTEEAWLAALDGEQEHRMLADGNLITPEEDDPTHGRSWSADARRAWGRP